MNVKSLAYFYLETLDSEKCFPFQDRPVRLTAKQVEQWHKGRPVLTIVSPLIDQNAFYKRFLEVAWACLKRQPIPQLVPESLIDDINNFSEKDLVELLKSAIQGVQRVQWSKKLGLSVEAFDFLIKVALKPLLTLFSKNIMHQFKPHEWLHGYCPVCGEEPVMARLTGENGQRQLYCGLCETEWLYYRIGCPFCGNQDSSTLSFIAAEVLGQYRIYLCEQCKSYLKTVDERICGEVDLFCEDIATVDLDELALKEGYNRRDIRHGLYRFLSREV
ncbi:formate dehydrogenase accessory protein FdhE [Desulfoscipio gibsoniae]